MNDFTKEELERILEGITWWLDGDDALYCEQLIDKIQSMIENYCEHDGEIRNKLQCMIKEHPRESSKPIIGLFGNNTQNQIMQDILDGINERQRIIKYSVNEIRERLVRLEMSTKNE